MITCLIVCITFVFSGFTSNAQTGSGSDGLDFYVPYAKPSGDGVGYVSFVLENKNTSVKQLITFFWCVETYISYDTTYGVVDEGHFGLVYLNGTDNSTINIEINNSSQNLMAVYSFGYYGNGSNSLQLVSNDLLFCESWYSYTLNVGANYNIVGVEFGGNAVFSNSNLRFTSTPRIHWGGDNSCSLLNEMLLIMGQNQAMFQTYFPKLNHIDFTLGKMHDMLAEMKAQLNEEEQSKMDNFVNNSTSQSGALSDLNNQTSVDKIDVNSMSQDIDANLDIATDANYGVLLSTITGNSNILTMLLMCASIALISFVFFGKR